MIVQCSIKRKLLLSFTYAEVLAVSQQKVTLTCSSGSNGSHAGSGGVSSDPVTNMLWQKNCIPLCCGDRCNGSCDVVAEATPWLGHYCILPSSISSSSTCSISTSSFPPTLVARKHKKLTAIFNDPNKKRAKHEIHNSADHCFWTSDVLRTSHVRRTVVERPTFVERP